MEKTITEFIREEVYPYIDAVAAGLLDSLAPRTGSSGSYAVNCPQCREQGRAYYKIGYSNIICNRENNCGKSTSIWDVLSHQGLSNADIVIKLCDAAGVQPPRKDSAQDSHTNASGTYNAFMSICHQALLNDTEAMDYLLNSRGWSQSEIERSPLGYIPRFEWLKEQLIKRHVDIKPLYTSGIFFTDPNREFDRAFEGRIIGLWRQPDGSNAIWGRRTDDNQSQKYKFQHGLKKTIPYNWHDISVQKAHEVVHLEGTMDAIRLTLNGVPACAIGGSSVTSEQALFLSAQHRACLHWLDADEAGTKGGERSILKLNPLGVDIAVIAISKTNWKDADEGITKVGAEQVKELIITSRQTAAHFLANRVAGAHADISKYKIARDFSRVLIGREHDAYMADLTSLGITIGSEKADALTLLANLLVNGLTLENATALVRRKTRFEITISDTSQ